MNMRSVALMFVSLTMGFAAVGTMASCPPTTTERYACPAGVPWVPDDHANGKWVPGHCLGQPAL